MSKRDYWDERYAASDLVWGTEPNRFVARDLEGLVPRGRALDLACGEGRNAIWLAKRGWRTTGVDFSRVAIGRAAKLAETAAVDVEWICADVTAWPVPPGEFSLVVISYLQLPGEDMTGVWASAARALQPAGALFAIGHALRNLEQGVGGPSDPAVLWSVEAIAGELRGADLAIDRALDVERSVEGADRPAIDALVHAHRPNVDA